MANSEVLKCKNIMYTQQVEHLPTCINTKEKLISVIESLNPKKFALILHDKDVNETGEPEKPHYHVMINFHNARSLNKIAEILHDEPQYIACWRGNTNIGYAYLTHNTKDSQHKYIYTSDEVYATFNYKEFVESYIKNTSAQFSETNIKVQLDKILSGEITVEELLSSLDAWTQSKYKRQIMDTQKRKLELDMKEWRKEMLASNKKIEVIWIYGAAGVGKSSFALDIAKNRNEPIFVSGSSKDIFQNYQGEHIAILDDFRPNTGGITYSDLLRILDPYNINENTMAPSRYSDKPLALDLIIITCPYSPKVFYDYLFPESTFFQKQSLDSFAQLRRRIALVMEINSNNIALAKFNGIKYEPDVFTAHHNKYSTYARTNSENFGNGEALYDKIFDEFISLPCVPPEIIQ